MTQGINLIINADDLGAGEPTDRGIIEAFTEGIVTSASLLANGSSFDKAVVMAKHANLPVGVHLNLSEGPSLTGSIPGLTDNKGLFLGKKESRKQFNCGAFDINRVESEFIAQINRVKQSGLHPDHLDTHQHSALFPTVTRALLNAAKATGIVRMRLPQPVQPASEDPSPPLGDELRLYRLLSAQLARQFIAAEIQTPAGLLGMPLLNRLNEAHLTNLLSRLKVGTWEMMVHPGYFDPQREFSSAERECELTALTAPAIIKLIQQLNIRLISFAELPCDC